MTMEVTLPPVHLGPPLPDHTQLPDSDGAIVENFLEHPWGELLTDSIWPVLKQLHPDNQFAIGMDSGIYWRFTDPPLDGCRAPDWFYVPNVPPMLEGKVRGSYVLWKELIAPRVILEYASPKGTGNEERDRTPWEGKFWIYEQAIRAPYYGIFLSAPFRLEMYRLLDGRYERMEPNEHGRYSILPLGLELGVWHGRFRNNDAGWLRWWDSQGKLLPTSEERGDQLVVQIEQERQRAEQERQRAEQERQRAEQERQRAERLAERLRQLGIDPDQAEESERK